MSVTENTNSFPPVSSVALANNREVINLLKQAIAKHGGRIRFDQFMEIAMFAPGFGYYDSVNRIFGDDGDFITAPEISSFFGKCLARQVHQLMGVMGHTNILEFGAGSGILAQTILTELEKLGQLPDTYYIYDISPTLRGRQFGKLKRNIPHLLDRVEWLSDIPQDFNGIIIANEVLDAMPVHRVVFQQNGNHKETYITLKDGKLVQEDGPVSSIEIKNEMDSIMHLRPDIKDGYRSEINLVVKDWVARVSKMLGQGVVFLIDYGCTRTEYYEPVNSEGKLICYFQHHPHGDPLLYPGIQDVTSHVDFSLVADAFQKQGLNVAGYTNQSFFLAGCGLESLYQELDSSDEKKLDEESRSLERLIMPNAMGEIFKAIAIAKDIDVDLIGFSVSNQKDSL